MDNVVVGIDVAKAGLEVHVLPTGEAFAVGRDAPGIDALIARLRPQIPAIGAPAMVAIEATGGLESVVAASPGAAGLPVVVVNPAQVRAFAQAHDRGIGGKRAETDPIDAPIAREGDRPVRSCHAAADPAAGGRRNHGPGGSDRPHLDVLGRQIIHMITAEGQREKRASKRMKKSIQRFRKELQKELTDIESEIPHGSRDSARGSPLWRHNEDLMVSVPGIGPAIARTLILHEPMNGLPELGTLDRREVAAPCGAVGTPQPHAAPA